MAATAKQRWSRAHGDSAPCHQAPGGLRRAESLISNDYAITVPDVQSGNYTGTLDYIASATP
jgi:hypothetical protein